MKTLVTSSPFAATVLLMRRGQAGASQATNPTKQWLATAPSLAVGASFFALSFWLLPSWLDFRVDAMGRGALALDRSCSVRARFRSGIKVHLGLWVDGTRNACADGSPTKACGGGILPICSESDVCGIPRGLDGSLGGLWACEPGCSRNRVRRCCGSSPLCATLRGTHAAKDVRPRL